MSVTVSSLCGQYKVTEEDLNKEISDLHLEEIVRESCTSWKSLPLHLGLENNLVKDIEKDFLKEADKRREFFEQWKQKEGSKATYERLVQALLDIKERKDAEYVCKLLCQTVPSSETSLDAPSGAIFTTKSSTCSLDPAILEDLKQQLDLNLQHIINRYASYVHCIRNSIEEKGVTAKNLCGYLMNLRAFKPRYQKQMPFLLSGMRDELEKAQTIDEIFIILSDKCASFLNFEIFQSMIEDYYIDKNQERLNYPQHLKDYVEKHKLSEFVHINPLLKKLDDSAKEIKLKLDIEITCSLAKLDDLRKPLANILGVMKSALRIVDIKEGCVEVTFLIPAPVADAIFTSDKIFTPQDVYDFQALSVLTLKFGGYFFEFKEESNPHEESAYNEVYSTELRTRNSSLDSHCTPANLATHEDHNTNPQALSGPSQPHESQPVHVVRKWQAIPSTWSITEQVFSTSPQVTMLTRPRAEQEPSLSVVLPYIVEPESRNTAQLGMLPQRDGTHASKQTSHFTNLLNSENLPCANLLYRENFSIDNPLYDSSSEGDYDSESEEEYVDVDDDIPTSSKR